MIRKETEKHLLLKAETLEHGMIHVVCSGYDEKEACLLDRYGIIQKPAADPKAVSQGESILFGDGYEFTLTSGGGFSLKRNGKTITSTLPGTFPASAPTIASNAGFRLVLPVDKQEKLIGFGDQVRTQLLLNGQHDGLWLLYPVKHVPVPFFMSSKGYGIFFNTTSRVSFDVACARPEEALFAVEKEFLEIYLFTGENYDEMIDAYTLLTGRPALPPFKSFGLWLLFQTWTTGNELISIARGIRSSGIPCDNLSLEPGWMEKYYDYSSKKDWNATRFRGTDAGCFWRGGPNHMCDTLKRMNYALGLWLCTRWDFTWEEERRLGKKPVKNDILLDLEGIELTHEDDNLGHAPIYQDEVTVREEPWFEHLKKFVNDGVRFFKLDPAWLINEFPDRLYGNGKTDAQMHNLAFLLASKQMKEDFEAFTGRRYYGISVAGWAGLQQYPGTWAGDTGGGKQAMTGLLQDAIVGHYCTTCDMNVKDIQGVHMGFFLPWALINSWAAFDYPGFLGEELDAVLKDYSSLRMSLLAYYYSLAYRASQTGRAILRPLCLVWPDQEWTYEERNMFMIGDFILVDVYNTADVRLPDGRWYDYWTGKVYTGNGQIQHIPYPENRGGHFFLREGAVLPVIPVKDHADPAIESVEWLVFPAEGTSSFDLYLDDGDTLAGRKGEYALQTVTRKGREVEFGKIRGGKPEFLQNVNHTVRYVGD